MKSYKQYLVEITDEVKKFKEIRKKIVSAKTREQLELVMKLFIAYNKIYGDKDLARKIDTLMRSECAMKCAELVIERAKRKIIALYNWHNNRRKSPDNINEVLDIKLDNI